MEVNPSISCRKKVLDYASYRYFISELDDWPPRDYGHLLDQSNLGLEPGEWAEKVPAKSYELLARGIFGRLPIGVKFDDEKWPALQKLAKIVIPGDMDEKSGVHPSFLEGLFFEELFRLFKFGIWVSQKREEKTYLTLKDIITQELDVYISHRMTTKLEFQAIRQPNQLRNIYVPEVVIRV